MKFDRRKFGIALIVVAALLLAAIIYFTLFRSSQQTPEQPLGNEGTPTDESNLPEAPIGTTTPSDRPSAASYDLAAEEPHVTNADDLGKLSMSFAERFGSFSNQSNYGNFTDLEIMMTPSMRTWAREYVETLRSQATDSSYYGITTKALTYEVKKFDENQGRAQVLVSTQRRESREAVGGGRVI
jgi:hypothetical protein